ncbi:adenylosuccinate lyase family protein [Microbulbifer variabilis]|uniref:class-II fumarase/aspartase family protein n=1 Tax=Microbulbifer variabilis TaxID=266805 RepID=UPI001CFF09E7|nr:adenylosuccinate lyase family protein [Microbulbifer variabilis]
MIPLSPIDSPLFGNTFVDTRMRKIFNFRAYLECCIKVEEALAKVQADLGIIPQSAYKGIAESIKNFQVDTDELQEKTAIVGYPILPLVEQLAANAGESGHYLHWGATTQDIMDTATVLQIRDGLELIETQVKKVNHALVTLAKKYRDTPMAGRTHLQQALPITFGYKAAVWLSSFERHLKRLHELKPRVLVVQFSGASGTLASLGKNGLSVQNALAKRLNLGVSSITWHSIRDCLAETVQILALICASLAKISIDISLMMTTEMAEVAEPFVEHRGSSSTMPQKRNPISCELIIAASKMVREKAALMLDGMAVDFERATGPWHLEWIAIPESFALTSGALSQAAFMLGGLEVHPEKMKANLDLTQGLIVSEAVMMALAPQLGRQAAHDLVYDACRQALESGDSLAQVLANTPQLNSVLDTKKIASLTDPSGYLGSAKEMVDRMINQRTGL